MSDTNVQRRQFLKTSVGAAAVAIAPGMLLFDMAHGKSEAVSSKVRWGMLIDTANCADGCNDCVNACNKENGLSGGLSPTDSQWMRKVELKDMRSGRAFVAADDVPALRGASLCGCLPDRRFFQARRRHRAGRQASLHRLPLLHDGLPVQGAFLRA